MPKDETYRDGHHRAKRKAISTLALNRYDSAGKRPSDIKEESNRELCKKSGSEKGAGPSRNECDEYGMAKVKEQDTRDRGGKKVRASSTLNSEKLIDIKIGSVDPLRG